MLHISNGDCATEYLTAQHYPGSFVAWQDVLHDGPLTGETDLEKISVYRNTFLAKQFQMKMVEVEAKTQKRNKPLLAYTGDEEMVLWLTPELFDALIALQFLSWHRARGLPADKLSIVFLQDHLPPHQQADEVLREAFEQRQCLTVQQWQLAETAWLAVINSNANGSPESILGFLQDNDFSVWPSLKTGLKRYAQEVAVAGQLNCTQQQILQLLSDGEKTLAALFHDNQQLEEVRFMGDWSFWNVLDGLREYIDIDHQGHLLHQPMVFYKTTKCRLLAKPA
ncbi:MAG: RNA polymerase subunit sigma-24 [Pseudomonadales bacterium]|nr:RNA polymerase subunit sigma-24 [Pseudomonadales bacterium]